MDDNEVFTYLTAQLGYDEPAQVDSYRAFTPSGEITVNVLDRGDDAGSNRFTVEAFLTATPADERNVTNASAYTVGNPATTLNGALANVHWWIFDAKD